jgi:hypothetical protein
MGKPRSKLDEQLRHVRYPTLQRVAHRLPTDNAYRSATRHAINVLERTPWAYRKKLQFANTLKEVYDSLAPSAKYHKRLDRAMPMNRLHTGYRPKGLQFKLTKCLPKDWRYRRGTNFYIRSLTTQKPIWTRAKKGKKK